MTAEAKKPLVPADDPAQAVGARFAGLEGYRGIAALLVVVFHVYQLIENENPGSIGGDTDVGYRVLHSMDGLVGLFFVLSAFLLFLPYVMAVLDGLLAPFSARHHAPSRCPRDVWPACREGVWPRPSACPGRNTQLINTYRWPCAW